MHGGGQSLRARLLAFGFGHPLDVFLFVAVTEVFEPRERLAVLLDRGQEVVRNDEFLFGGTRGPRHFDPLLIELHRLLDVPDDYGIARQIPGLNYSKWLTDRKNPSLLGQLTADQQAALSQGLRSTPTVTVTGPKGTSQPLVGPLAYSAYQQAISSVGG